jgi:uncharacterized protein Yka (UPF0111/DUF47 family)
VGEPVPKIDGNVITFMADGAELDVLLAAMRDLSGEQMAALAQSFTELGAVVERQDEDLRDMIGVKLAAISGRIIVLEAKLDQIRNAARRSTPSGAFQPASSSATRIVDGDALRAIALAAAYDDGLIDMIQALGAAVKSAKEKQVPPTWDYLEQFATEAAEITRTIVATRPFSQMAQEKPDGDPHEGRPNTGA